MIRVPLSISFSIMAVILAVNTMILALFAGTYYLQERAEQLGILRKNLEISADQLTSGLAAPVWSFDDNHINLVLDGFMKDRTVAFLELRTDDKVYQRSRNARWETTNTIVPTVAGEVIEQKRQVVFAGKEIGTVRIGLTKKYIREMLISNAIMVFSVIVLLDAAMCLSLYLILSRKLLRPLAMLDRFAGAVIDGHDYRSGIAEQPFWGELETLRRSLVSMVDNLNTRLQEQMRAEDELRRSQKMLSTIIDSLPQAVFWKGRNFNYLGCNRTFAEDAGFADPAQIVGRNDFELPWRGDADLYRNDDTEVMDRNETRMHIIEPLQKADGRRVWLDTSKTPLIDDTGSVYGVLGIYEDITDRKLADEAFRAEKERAELYLNIVEVILVALDGDGRITMLNRKGCKVLGYELEELLGRDWISVCIPADEQDQVRSVFREIISGNLTRFEYNKNRVTTKSGQYLLIEWHNTVLRDAGGYIIGTLSSGDDITERNKLEEQLHQSQKMESIGRLAGGVAHDFNNMLSVIMGAAEISLEKAADDAAMTRLLQQILKAAERSSQITRQLLAFSRKQVISPKPVNLNSLLIESEKMLFRLIGEDVSLSFHPATGLWTTLIDPSQLDQILMNLCVNARDAMPNGGSLNMETANFHIGNNYSQSHLDAHPGDYVLLTVSDTGIGMDRETQQNIFEPFFTTKGVGQGTGLGLATVYGIVTQNNGFITVYSEPGQGTCFKIFLPRHMEEARPEEKKETVPVIGTGTILLVEDEEMLLWTATQMLEGIGYTIIQAASARDAIAICADQEQRIDLILTDVVMPEMNGREMMERIREMRPDQKVLFTSGYTAEIVAQRGIVEEGMQFISKPLDKHQLSEKIRQVLAT